MPDYTTKVGTSYVPFATNPLTISLKENYIPNMLSYIGRYIDWNDISKNQVMDKQNPSINNNGFEVQVFYEFPRCLKSNIAPVTTGSDAKMISIGGVIRFNDSQDFSSGNSSINWNYSSLSLGLTKIDPLVAAFQGDFATFRKAANIRDIYNIVDLGESYNKETIGEDKNDTRAKEITRVYTSLPVATMNPIIQALNQMIYDQTVLQTKTVVTQTYRNTSAGGANEEDVCNSYDPSITFASIKNTLDQMGLGTDGVKNIASYLVTNTEAYNSMISAFRQNNLFLLETNEKAFEASTIPSLYGIEPLIALPRLNINCNDTSSQFLPLRVKDVSAPQAPQIYDNVRNSVRYNTFSYTTTGIVTNYLTSSSSAYFGGTGIVLSNTINASNTFPSFQYSEVLSAKYAPINGFCNAYPSHTDCMGPFATQPYQFEMAVNSGVAMQLVGFVLDESRKVQDMPYYMNFDPTSKMVSLIGGILSNATTPSVNNDVGYNVNLACKNFLLKTITSTGTTNSPSLKPFKPFQDGNIGYGVFQFNCPQFIQNSTVIQSITTGLGGQLPPIYILNNGTIYEIRYKLFSKGDRFNLDSAVTKIPAVTNSPGIIEPFGIIAKNTGKSPVYTVASDYVIGDYDYPGLLGFSEAELLDKGIVGLRTMIRTHNEYAIENLGNVHQIYKQETVGSNVSVELVASGVEGYTSKEKSLLLQIMEISHRGNEYLIESIKNLIVKYWDDNKGFMFQISLNKFLKKIKSIIGNDKKQHEIQDIINDFDQRIAKYHVDLDKYEKNKVNNERCDIAKTTENYMQKNSLLLSYVNRLKKDDNYYNDIELDFSFTLVSAASRVMTPGAYFPVPLTGYFSGAMSQDKSTPLPSTYEYGMHDIEYQRNTKNIIPGSYLSQYTNYSDAPIYYKFTMPSTEAAQGTSMTGVALNTDGSSKTVVITNLKDGLLICAGVNGFKISSVFEVNSKTGPTLQVNGAPATLALFHNYTTFATQASIVADPIIQYGPGYKMVHKYFAKSDASIVYTDDFLWSSKSAYYGNGEVKNFSITFPKQEGIYKTFFKKNISSVNADSIPSLKDEEEFFEKSGKLMCSTIGAFPFVNSSGIIDMSNNILDVSGTKFTCWFNQTQVIVPVVPGIVSVTSAGLPVLPEMVDYMNEQSIEKMIDEKMKGMKNIITANASDSFEEKEPNGSKKTFSSRHKRTKNINNATRTDAGSINEDNIDERNVDENDQDDNSQ
jgi:hypothetical protein